MKTRFLLLGCLISASAAIGMYALRTPSPSTGAAGLGANEQPRSTRDTASIQRIAGIGFVEPETEVRRLVFSVDGVITQCAVNVGDHVTCGQLLMVLRNQREQRAVELARKECDLAQADRKRILAGVETNEVEAARRQAEISGEKYQHAKLERERYSMLQEKRAASRQDYDLAETTLKQTEVQLLMDRARLRHLEHFVRTEDVALADAKVAVAKEKIEVAQRMLDETFLRAPCDGTILEILKREGDGTHVADGHPAVIFADLSHLRVRAEIDERYVHRLSVSMPAAVTGRAVGFREFHGTVSRVNQIMGPKTVFARVADERRDLDVVQVLIDMKPDFQFPVGLRVDVYLEPGSRKE